MSHFGRGADPSKGRRGSRIDLEEGGHYVGIPQIPVSRHTSRLPSTRCPRNRGRYRYTMHTQHGVRDALYFAKAFLTNQIARFAPSLYLRLAQDTGRGGIAESAEQIAVYFLRCFDDYRTRLGFAEGDFASFLRGKTVLEYGPGDTQALAVMLYAHGARVVHGVDRFPLQRFSSTNARVYELILDSLEPEPRRRATAAFRIPGRSDSGFNPDAIQYFVTNNGLSRYSAAYDLIISRAVLEHVNYLDESIADIARALAPGGVSVHEVDLRSHGLDRYRPLDFLTWPDALYRLMYSHKGFPNRWRVDRYKTLAHRNGLRIKALQPTELLQRHDVDAIKPELAKAFQEVSIEELSWLSFWMILEHDTYIN